VVDFLKSFFEDKKIFKPSYFETPGPFLEYLNDHKPQAVIAEDSFLSSISDRTTRFPVITIITGNIKMGLETAINHHSDHYLYTPYFVQDLEYKLEKSILDRDEFSFMKHEIRELGIVAELSQLISSTLDPKEVLYRIVKKIADVMPVSRCSIIRVDWLRKSAFVVASHDDPDVVNIRLDLKKYPEIMAAFKTRELVVVKDISSDPLMKRVRKLIMSLGVKSILVIPIKVHEKVIGTLFLRTARAEHTFSESEVRLMNVIANTSANALYNAILFEQVEDEKSRLEKLAITDYLTGVYNVRYFYHHIIEEFNRSERYVFPISCVMLDIDYFKKINDEYGHRTGDLVLKEFAGLLKKCSRKSDVLARYGGEEFILMMPQTSAAGALAEAERIRLYVKNHKFKSIKNKKCITVSIGVSFFPHPEVKTHDELITFADNALFEAKNSGRDKVVVYQ
jgi:two-component system cell cycle response regulator